MEEINLKELLLILKKRLWIVFLCAILVGAASAVVTFFILKPVYKAETSLYVGKQINNDTTIAYNDILVSDRLVNDYRELVKSRLVAESVIRELSIKGLKSGQISEMLEVSSKKDTRIILISASNQDPKLAMDITNKVAEVFKKSAIEIMEVQNVQLVDTAVLPTTPIKPSKTTNTSIGLILGIMIGLGIIFLLEYLDNTIKTPDDVKKHLDLPVIGTIPVFPN